MSPVITRWKKTTFAVLTASALRHRMGINILENMDDSTVLTPDSGQVTPRPNGQRGPLLENQVMVKIQIITSILYRNL